VEYRRGILPQLDHDLKKPAQLGFRLARKNDRNAQVFNALFPELTMSQTKQAWKGSTPAQRLEGIEKLAFGATLAQTGCQEANL
jgi:hypothetical protein